ncbi:MAG: sugar nucleotide-binding protein [Burkholderiales bacterium]|nr:sugar nucleotide-binding protein [Burkholderiales bacterium]
MRLLITGLSGTLAPVLARVARAHGHVVLGWDHRSLGFADGRAFDRLRPDAVAHLAMAPAEGSAQLAGLAAARGLPFLMTSTAMVFHHEPDGPHHVGDARTAQDTYGRSKVASEDAVHAAHAAHAQASVVRIGWQIDPFANGNNMLAQLDRWQAEQGEVAASRAWKPACSFMADTAEGLLALLPQPGVHHLDSNAQEAWSFAELVLGLQSCFERHAWRVRVHADYTHDQRLACVPGDPVPVPLSARLALRRL